MTEPEHGVAHGVVDVGAARCAHVAPTTRAPIRSPRPAKRYWTQPASEGHPAARGNATSVTVTSLTPSGRSTSGVTWMVTFSAPPVASPRGSAAPGERRLHGPRHAARNAHQDDRAPRVAAPVALERALGWRRPAG